MQYELIEEFSLEHVRKTEGIYYQVGNDVEPKLHDVWLQIRALFY